LKTKKIHDLTNIELEWAVAKCEGRDMYVDSDGIWFRDTATHKDGFKTDYSGWTLCGPIIEREKISLKFLNEGDGWCAYIGCIPHDFLLWNQSYDTSNSYGEGPTPLIAAMRCYVTNKLMGDKDIEPILKHGHLTIKIPPDIARFED